MMQISLIHLDKSAFWRNVFLFGEPA